MVGIIGIIKEFCQFAGKNKQKNLPNQTVLKIIINEYSHLNAKPQCPIVCLFVCIVCFLWKKGGGVVVGIEGKIPYYSSIVITLITNICKVSCNNTAR